MTVFKGYRSGKKPSGARYWPGRKKKSSEVSKDPVPVKLSENLKRITKRLRGGSTRHALLTVSHVNVSDGKKIKRVKIKTVVENTANRQFVRQNVVNKGAIVDTEIGKAKITSRPTKDGVANAVLIK